MSMSNGRRYFIVRKTPDAPAHRVSTTLFRCNSRSFSASVNPYAVVIVDLADLFAQLRIFFRGCNSGKASGFNKAGRRQRSVRTSRGDFSRGMARKRQAGRRFRPTVRDAVRHPRCRHPPCRAANSSRAAPSCRARHAYAAHSGRQISFSASFRCGSSAVPTQLAPKFRSPAVSASPFPHRFAAVPFHSFATHHMRRSARGIWSPHPRFRILGHRFLVRRPFLFTPSPSSGHPHISDTQSLSPSPFAAPSPNEVNRVL